MKQKTSTCNSAANELSKRLRHYLLTYGLGKMQKSISLLEKWLVERPDDAITIICPERKPRELIGKLLDAVAIPNQALDSTDDLPSTSEFWLKIPSLHDRIEDLPLITESTLKTHFENHDIEVDKIPFLCLAAFFFLCWKYKSPLQLKTPILTYDRFISYLQNFLDSGQYRLPPYKLIYLEYYDGGHVKRNHTLPPFASLHDGIVTVHLSDVPQEDVGFCAHEDNELRASLIAPDTDMETSRTINEHRMHLRAAVSGEFRHFVVDKPSGFSRQQLARKVQLDDIQRQMIKVGSKFAPVTGKTKMDPVPQIYLKHRDSYRALVRFIVSQATAAPSGHETKPELVTSDQPTQGKTKLVLKSGGRLIECRHGNLDFTPNQAKVVSVHYEEYLKDNDYLCEQDVLEQVDLSTKTYDNIFKSRRDHFKKLFENHRKQKDLWRFRTDL